jgi:hypothetical protein
MERKLSEVIGRVNQRPEMNAACRLQFRRE